jgi:hypothetical protein
VGKAASRTNSSAAFGPSFRQYLLARAEGTDGEAACARNLLRDLPGLPSSVSSWRLHLADSPNSLRGFERLWSEWRRTV